VPDNHLEKALGYLGQDARALAMDSLYCELHNTWATLEGNKPEEDAEWLARNLYDRQQMARLPHWDRAGDDVRGTWLRLAASVIELLPLYCGRIAHRYEAARNAMEVIAKAERVALRKMREGERGEP
jgi:hypothetical protein